MNWLAKLYDFQQFELISLQVFVGGVYSWVLSQSKKISRENGKFENKKSFQKKKVKFCDITLKTPQKVNNVKLTDRHFTAKL